MFLSYSLRAVVRSIKLQTREGKMEMDKDTFADFAGKVVSSVEVSENEVLITFTDSSELSIDIGFEGDDQVPYLSTAGTLAANVSEQQS